MTDKQLEYILTIANEGNITRAAAKLYVSQASLSQVLQYVEKEIGVTIFSRTPLPLKPTYEGELFFAVGQTDPGNQTKPDGSI